MWPVNNLLKPPSLQDQAWDGCQTLSLLLKISLSSSKQMARIVPTAPTSIEFLPFLMRKLFHGPEPERWKIARPKQQIHGGGKEKQNRQAGLAKKIGILNYRKPFLRSDYILVSSTSLPVRQALDTVNIYVFLPPFQQLLVGIGAVCFALRVLCFQTVSIFIVAKPRSMHTTSSGSE